MPAAARQHLEERLKTYRQRHPGARWTPPDTWHLTLLFLGSVDPASVPDLRRLIDHAAVRIPGPYPIRLDQGEGRSHRGIDVAWLGASEGASRLIALADALAQACPPGITHGMPARRSPSAHLTVARSAGTAVIGDLREQRLGPVDVAWTIDRLVLMRSHLSPHGASYETLYERAL